MRAEIKGFHSPDVDDLERFAPTDPGRFTLLLQVLIGPVGEPGEDSFDIVVCTPGRLAEEAEGGPRWLRHRLLVSDWEWHSIREFIERWVSSASGETWLDLAGQLGRYGQWEFEDYANRSR